MQDKTVSVNDVRLHAEAFGDPGDATILLVMGATASGVWWPQAFCEDLAAQGRHVIRYDHRDTGASSKCAPGELDYSLEDLADDMMRVLDAYGVERAHLAGMSLGGLLSQLASLKFPDRVMSLTLIASEPFASVNEELPPIDQKLMEHHVSAANIDWTNRDAVVAFNVEAWRLTAGNAHPFNEAHIRKLAEQDFDRNDQPLSAMNHAQLAGGEQWFDRLDEVDVPALIIHGTADPVLNFRNAELLAEKLRKSRLLALEGVGHELHPDDWPAITSALVTHTTADG